MSTKVYRNMFTIIIRREYKIYTSKQNKNLMLCIRFLFFYGEPGGILCAIGTTRVRKLVHRTNFTCVSAGPRPARNLAPSFSNPSI